MTRLNAGNLGGWTDALLHDGVYWLSRTGGGNMLWQCADWGADPYGRVGELGLAQVDVSQADAVTLTGATGVDCLAVLGGDLWACGWVGDECAFWRYDGSTWTLAGQGGAVAASSRQLLGMALCEWGIVAAGPAGVFVLRGSGVTQEGLAWSGVGVPASYGNPVRVGNTCVVAVRDASGNALAATDGNGVWRRSSGPNVFRLVKWDGALWGFLGETAGTQQLVRLVSEGDSGWIAEWTVTLAGEGSAVDCYTLPAAADGALLLFNAQGATGGFLAGCLRAGELTMGEALPWAAVLSWHSDSGLACGQDAFGGVLPEDGSAGWYANRGQMVQYGSPLGYSWAPVVLFGSDKLQVFSARLEAQTAVKVGPEVTGARLEASVGDGVNRPEVTAAVLSASVGGGISRPEVTAARLEAQTLVKVGPEITGATLEASIGDGVERPEVLAARLEAREAHEPGVGDLLLTFVDDDDDRPATALRIVAGGLLADEAGIAALVRVDAEALGVDAWASYQPAALNETITLRRPGNEVRVLLSAAAGQPPDVSVQYKREETD